MAVKFRKATTRKQGLKILAYGENGAGKSIFTLSFPKNAIIDSESKIGVYENNPKYRDNIAGIADTANYRDTLELLETVVNNPKEFDTLTIDSMTNVYVAMQVSAMENEEERARKKNLNVDDQVISMRGYGRLKLDSQRLDGYIAQASAKGVNVIAVAHKKDLEQEVGGKRVKIGERADLRKNAEHTFDVILKFYKEKDIVTGQYKFFVDVEKDTTETHKIGTKLEGATYEIFKSYLENQSESEVVETNYDKTIESNISDIQEEQEEHEEVVKKFKELFKQAVDKDANNKLEVSKLMKQHGVEKYNDASLTKELKQVIVEIEKLLK